MRGALTDQVTTARAARSDRASTTQEAILTAAERLFAEHGVFAVSNRQVSEAAGQGNNAAVGYHFGTKTDLVRAIERRHREPIERLREDMARSSGSRIVGRPMIRTGMSRSRAMRVTTMSC